LRFIGEPIHALQLHYERIFKQEICKVFSDRVALVKYGKRSLGHCTDAPQAEFSEQSALVHLLQKSGAEGV
jgi:hypothetical protein